MNRRRLTKIALLSAIILCGTILFSWPTILRYLIGATLQEARRSGTKIGISELSTGMGSARASSLTIWVPGPPVKGLRLPVSIDLTDVSVALLASSFWDLTPAVEYSANLYGGSVSGVASSVIGSPRISAVLKGISIARHPQVMALGFGGGVLDARLDGVTLAPGGVSSGTATLALEGLSLPENALVTQMLKIDSLGAVSLYAKAEARDRLIVAEDVSLKTIFGTVQGRIQLSQDTRAALNLKGDARVELSQRGSEVVSPWMPLATRGTIDAARRSFRVQVSSIPCSRSSEYPVLTRYRAECIGLSFTKDE